MKELAMTTQSIGEKTHQRPWCKYELDRSIEDGKGILGILLPNQTEHGPKWISKHGKVYNWDHDKFPGWVEQAAKDAGR